MLKKILKYKVWAIGVLAFLLLSTHFISAYFFGSQIYTAFNTQFYTMTNSPFIKVIHYEYKRGWFTSDAKVEIALNNKLMVNILKSIPNIDESAFLNKQYSINYVMHVKQGLFSGFFSGDFVPKLAVANLDIQYSPVIKDLLVKFFGKKEPVTIINTLYLNHFGVIRIDSPAFDYNEAISKVAIHWGGLNATIRYNDAFNSFITELGMSEFYLDAPSQCKIEVNNVEYFSTAHNSINNIKVGNTKLSLEKIAFQLTDKAKLQLKIGDLLNALTGISTTEFLNELNIINAQNFGINKLSYITNSKDENNFFDATARINVTSFISESQTYGPLDFDLSINHILSPSLSDVTNEISRVLIEDNNNNSNQLQQQVIAILKSRFAPILVNKPLISINKFNLYTSKGLVSFNGFFTTNNFGVADIENQRRFFKKISFRAKFSIPKDVLMYLFMVEMRYFLNAGNAEMDAQSNEALQKVVGILLNNQLNKWKKYGLIEESHNMITSNILYTEGKLRAYKK